MVDDAGVPPRQCQVVLSPDLYQRLVEILQEAAQGERSASLERQLLARFKAANPWRFSG